MTPATTSTNWLQNLPPAIAKKFERLNRNFRFVTPLAEEDKTEEQRKYGKVDYFVGYRLPAAAVEKLAIAADKKCYKCLGTGIKDWRNQGLKARVCKCARDLIVAGAITADKITATEISTETV